MTKDLRILAGITQNNELYFLEIEPKKEGHNYFSMSGFTVEPITIEGAETRQEEMFDSSEYEDFWREAVQSKRTLQSFDDWLDDVKSEQGWGDTLDNSLYPNEIEIDGVDYGFISGSCGQHEEENLKYYSIPKTLFTSLISIWQTYHLKENPDNLDVLISQINSLLKQKSEEEMVKEAVRFINDNN